MITLTQIAAFRDTDTLEKARHGRYADTAKNRRLHRVGQEYGSKKQEDPESEKKPQAQQEVEQPKKERNGDSVKRELELLEEHKDSIIEKYGEKAYNKKVESLKKEGEDFEQKETVKELKERADREDADKLMKEEEEKKQHKNESDLLDEASSAKNSVKEFEEYLAYLKHTNAPEEEISKVEADLAEKKKKAAFAAEAYEKVMKEEKKKKKFDVNSDEDVKAAKSYKPEEVDAALSSLKERMSDFSEKDLLNLEREIGHYGSYMVSGGFNDLNNPKFELGRKLIEFANEVRDEIRKRRKEKASRR